jgi:hypothetical protein
MPITTGSSNGHRMAQGELAELYQPEAFPLNSLTFPEFYGPIRFIRTLIRTIRTLIRIIRMSVRTFRTTVRFIRTTVRFIRTTVRFIRPTVRIIRTTVRTIRSPGFLLELAILAVTMVQPPPPH